MAKARKNVLMLLALIMLVVLCNTVYSQGKDPLDDEFYQDDNLTSIDKIAGDIKTITELIEKTAEKIDEGVDNTKSLTKLEIKQVQLSEQQRYLAQLTVRNSSRLDEHAKLIRETSGVLQGITEAIKGLKVNLDWKYTLGIAVLSIVGSGCIQHFVEKKTTR